LRFNQFIPGVAAAFASISGAGAANLDWRAQAAATLEGLTDVRRDRETGHVFAYAGEKRFRLSLTGEKFSLTPALPAKISVVKADPIPDGRVALGDGMISQAWLSEPTLRYRHGVLGDNVEAEMLNLRLKDGSVLTFQLPNDSVYEDLEPRLIELNGEEAVLVVRSYLNAGAAIAVYGVDGEKIEALGESYPIGLSHRWLNPVGAADFDGDGITEIAAVVTPHLSGLLTLYQRDGDRFVRDGVRSGYSTHFIGSTVLAMSLIEDANGDGIADIILPSLDRDSLDVVSFATGRGRELLSLPQSSEIVTSVVAADLDGAGALEIVFGREDGSLIVIRR
jgi:hypothetical protein